MRALREALREAIKIKKRAENRDGALTKESRQG